jgi:mannosylglycerate hydrolase
MVTPSVYKNINKIVIVSHTHWDREWYQSFQEYRLRLLKTIDKLLRIFQKDSEYKYFLFDGQIVPLEDYLELRSDNRETLFKMIRGGKIGIGPWYTQPDEWLSYPESIVRNLLMGKKICDKLNLPILKVGYTPDTFGHTAQLPQILNGFGIESFLFMRGLGDEGEDLGTEFLWLAPDNSRVIAIHLLTSYSNGVFLGSLVGHPHIFYYGDIYPKTVKIWKSGNLEVVTHFGIYEKEPKVTSEKAEKQIDWLLEQVASKIRSSTLLIMNGADHSPPQESLSMIIRELREHFKDKEIIHGKLEDYLFEVHKLIDTLPVYKGELRGAKYEWVLPNTLSTRIPQIKYPSYIIQTMVPYYVEPLATISWLLGETYPHDILDYIWKLILQNLAHDSICGCGIDEIHKDVNTRFRHAIEISKNIIYDKMAFLASQIDTSALGDADMFVVVFNPLNWSRTDLVKLYTELPIGKYMILDEDGSELPVTLRKVHIKEVFTKKRVAELLFIANNVPPIGYKTYRLKHLSSDIEGPTLIHVTTIENEFFKVEADPYDGGLLKITDKLTGVIYKKFNMIIDEGDAGDEYTFSPPNEQIVFTNEGIKADIWVEKAKSYSCLNIKFTMRIPKCLNGQKRSNELIDMPIHEKIYLYPNVPRIDVSITIDNRAMDHRIRVAFPTGLKVKFSSADTHFYVIERPTIPPKGEGWQERPAVDHPQIYWVDVSDGSKGVMLANRGLPEYKLDSDGTLYITLLRCVGYLFKSDLLTRPGTVNLSIPTSDAQCIGRFNFHYSIIPHKGNWDNNNVFKEALNFAIPMLAITTDKHKGKLNTKSSLLALESKNVVITALKKAEKEDSLIIRYYNASNEPTSSKLSLDMLKDYVKEVWKANLSEENVEKLKLNDILFIYCKPWEIVTLKFIKS